MTQHSSQPARFNHVTDAAPEYVDVILWHRVALVAGGLVVALAGIGFLLFQLLSTPDSPEDASPFSLNPDTLEAPAAIPAPDLLAQTTEPALEDAASLAVESTPESAISPESTVAMANTVEEAMPVEAVAEPVATEPEPDSAASQDSRYQVHTRILVPAVKRALITDTMRGREPGNPLTSTLPLANNSRFSLYQFVDIRGQAGETLIYHWKRNGKTVAKVRIPVGSDKWRNYSSKNFNQKLTGDWQVDVTNSKGMLLVRSDFHLGQ